MIQRAVQFSEIIVIDALYGTKNLKIPLICSYGASNIGGRLLKTFPIAFYWVPNETEIPIACLFGRWDSGSGSLVLEK